MSNEQVEKIDIKETMSLSDAAEVLGLDSFRHVKALIKRGLLRKFKSKFSRNARVLASEVQELCQLEEEVSNGGNS